MNESIGGSLHGLKALHFAYSLVNVYSWRLVESVATFGRHGVLDTSASPAKTDVPIETPLGADSRGPKETHIGWNHIGATWRTRRICATAAMLAVAAITRATCHHY